MTNHQNNEPPFIDVLKSPDEDTLEGYETLEISFFPSAQIQNVDMGRFFIKRRRLDTKENYGDSFLFEPDYNLATATGFSVWEGSWILLKALCNLKTDNNALTRFLQESIQCKTTILELGSGTGITALGIASVGARVISTDVNTLVNGILLPNLQLNQHMRNQGVKNNNKSSTILEPASTIQKCEWISVGAGQSCSAPLDWTKPFSEWEEDVKNVVQSADAILAVETIWLTELVADLIGTIKQALSHMQKFHGKKCFGYLLFSERAKSNAKEFVKADTVLQQFEMAGCVVQSLCTGVFSRATDTPLPWRFVQLSLSE